MKKIWIWSLGVLLLMSSCGSYEASGAFTGAHFGSVIGSAIGGITGGWHGRDVGTLIGIASGAAVGAAVGRAADDAAQARQMAQYDRRAGINARQSVDESGFDPEGRGDDRIVIDNMRSSYTDAPSLLEISQVKLVDASRDGQLVRNESAHIVFEIHNPTSKPVYTVQPSVREVSGNKHIHISENILVECIQPKQTIRYTAQIKADNRLRDGEAVVRIAVFQAGREILSQTRDLRILTSKR